MPKKDLVPNVLPPPPFEPPPTPVKKAGKLSSTIGSKPGLCCGVRAGERSWTCPETRQRNQTWLRGRGQRVRSKKISELRQTTMSRTDESGFKMNDFPTITESKTSTEIFCILHILERCEVTAKEVISRESREQLLLI